MPGILGLVVPWLLSLMICVLLAGRSLSLARLSVSVAVSQLLFHLLFVLGTITPSATSSPHVHGAPLVLPPSTGIPEAVIADGSMWLGHGVAALLTILALHRGERLALALRQLAAQAVRWVQRRIDAVIVRPGLPSLRRVRGEFRATLAFASVLLATLRGRAPPAHSAI